MGIEAVIYALSITLVIEPFLFATLNKYSFKIFCVSTLINLFLNTFMNTISVFVMSESYRIVFVVNFEIFTIFIEALLVNSFTHLGYKKMLRDSLLVNLASLIAGLFLNIVSDLIFWPVVIINIILFSVFFTLTFLNYRYDKEDQSNAKS